MTMRYLIPILVILCLAATAAGQVITIVPQAPAPPARIVVQSYVPVTTFSWGPLHQALWPRTRWVPGPATTYVPEEANGKQNTTVREPSVVAPEPVRFRGRPITLYGPYLYGRP